MPHARRQRTSVNREIAEQINDHVPDNSRITFRALAEIMAINVSSVKTIILG
jgi:ribosomal protein S25